MKAILFFSVLLLSNFTTARGTYPFYIYDINKYIEIKHTGMEEKPVKTLIISTKIVNFEINNESDLGLNPNNKVLTPEQKRAILSLQYNFIVTNTSTYQAIVSFVSSNHQFFTNNTNKNHGDYMDYSISVEGKTYNIFYKLKDHFFSKLRLYLETHNGDRILIKKLEAY